MIDQKNTDLVEIGILSKPHGLRGEIKLNLHSPDSNLIINIKEVYIDSIVFKVSAPGHPFLIKLKPGTGKKNLVENVNNNGVAKGVIEWVPTEPGTYYYQCLKHKGMVGKIIIS